MLFRCIDDVAAPLMLYYAQHLRVECRAARLLRRAAAMIDFHCERR